MKRIVLLLVLFALALAAQKPKRVNKAIELLEQGQPIYYTGSHGGFEEGVKMAQTWADYITYEMEHGPYDVQRLAEFMRGLVKGGPTKSGHRTPAVIVTLPVGGLDEATMKANYWMVQQVLATGIHGILLCHARSPEAVKVFVEATRYPFNRLRVGEGLNEGLRGSGGQGGAAQVWGLSIKEYLEKAEPWPLNPKGELLLGLKIEDKYAANNVERTLKVPGIAFAEWGPGDMGMSLGYPDNHDEPYPKPMADARARVLAACKANKIFFLNSVAPNNVVKMIGEGVMIGSGGQQAAEVGRKHTKRSMPW
jgi:4-hydroxy-2-oxoheptanedioate aldolase